MQIKNLGLIDYRKALEFMTDLVGQVYQQQTDETLIICHHPGIVTLGKKSSTDEICGWKGPIFNVSRGGKATYHGPGQVVAYPIINMRRRNNDIYALLRALESSVVECLLDYGIDSQGDDNNSGVWVKNKKIASIGLAIKRGITYHGIAVNLFNDPMAFQGINPCGMDTSTMTDLETLLHTRPERSGFEEKFTKQLQANIDALVREPLGGRSYPIVKEALSLGQ